MQNTWKNIHHEIVGNFYDLPVSDEEDDTIPHRANNVLVSIKQEVKKLFTEFYSVADIEDKEGKLKAEIDKFTKGF